ncbi:25751_t:CDS:1, partial [Dentiscutata erythropus]
MLSSFCFWHFVAFWELFWLSCLLFFGCWFEDCFGFFYLLYLECRFGDCLGYLIYSVLSVDLEIVFGIESLDPKPTLDPDSDASLGQVMDSDLGTSL